MYSGQLKLRLEDFEADMDLLRAAHKFCIVSLKNYLSCHIVECHIQPEKALQIYEFGHFYDNKMLLEMATKIIKK
jgi:hypothetical protein